MNSTNDTAHPDTQSGVRNASAQVNGQACTRAAEPAAHLPETAAETIVCPTCEGHGTLTRDRAGIVEQGAQILHRAIVTAMQEASAEQWRAKAARWRAMTQPRPGDYLGQSTPQERAERRQRVEVKAREAEMRAAILEGPDAVLALAERLGLADASSAVVPLADAPIVDGWAA